MIRRLAMAVVAFEMLRGLLSGCPLDHDEENDCV